jgi:hypothetical protein
MRRSTEYRTDRRIRSLRTEGRRIVMLCALALTAGPVQLPNAAGAVGRAIARHDYANGCRAFSDCHGYIVRHPIAVASLAPDIAAPWTLEAWLAGRDPGMEAVAAALRP